MAEPKRSGKQRRSGSAFFIPSEGLILGECRSVLAIDPGARNCGMAWFEDAGAGWYCIMAGKYDPYDCLDHTRSWLGSSVYQTLVIEEFRLYPSKTSEQVLTNIGVVEVIGALRYLYAEVAASLPGYSVVMQGASIKSAGARRMEANGIGHRGRNVHARDAEMHGWFFILAKLSGLVAG